MSAGIMKSEQIDMPDEFQETFRIHIIWRILLSPIVLIVTLSFTHVPMACFILLTSVFLGEDFPLPLPILLLYFVFTHFYCLFLSIFALVRLWISRIHLTDKGIRFMALGAFWEILFPWRVIQDRLVSWKEVFGTRRLITGEYLLAIARGRFIDVTMFAPRERMLEVVDAMLTKYKPQDSPKMYSWWLEQFPRIVVLLAFIGVLLLMIKAIWIVGSE